MVFLKSKIFLLLANFGGFLIKFCETASSAPCVNEPCAINKNSIQFNLLGDWGGLQIFPYVSYTQHEVAEIMVQLAKKKGKPEFLIALGDNFYWKGVENVDDSRFKKTYQNIYTDEELKVPWYVLAGNHDHHGNVSAQVAFSSKDERWNFPSLYYVINYQLGDGTKIRVIMIDTIVLCGNNKKENFDHMIDGSEGSDQPEGPKNEWDAVQHWNWIENRLNESLNYDFLLVAGHFPVYSISSHGPTNCLVDKLKPLLEKYKVTAYLSGHEHSLQHIATTYGNNTVMNYVISGTGAFMDASKKHLADVPSGSLKFFFPTSLRDLAVGKLGFGQGGIVAVEGTKDSMAFIFYASEAKEIYRFSAQSRLKNNQ